MRAYLKLLVLLALCLVNLTAQAQRNAGMFESGGVVAPGKRVALVIGNTEYQAKNNLPPLKNPVYDADDIGEALKNFGFEVVIHKNLDRSRMLEVLEQFRLNAGGSEAALFYFAGHGQQERNKNYLMPIDGKAGTTTEVIGTGIDVNEQILVQLEGSTRIAIAMLDACRMSVSGRARGGVQGLTEMVRPEGSVIAFATAPNKTAAETSGNGRNGLWTESLLKAFKGRDLSLDGVLYAASLETRKTSGGYQTPYSNGDDILKKNFYFKVMPTVTVEQTYWDSIKAGNDAADFEAYLKIFPRGNFQALAENRLRSLRDHALKPAPEQPMAAGKAFKDCADCPEMVVIPAGSFQMGSENGKSDKKPIHSVTIAKPFALGKTEVTQAQWRAVMGNNPSDFKDCGDDCPVEYVTWNDAQEFIKKLNAKTGKQYRLPSEAEWEYACRAGGKHTYCGGNDINAVAWYGAYVTPVGNSGKHTNPVARKQANAWGLYDMSGNVWEWVEDCYHNSYSSAPADGSAWTGGACDRRMLRGGSWYDYPIYLRAADRFSNGVGDRNTGNGFRVARTLP